MDGGIGRHRIGFEERVGRRNDEGERPVIEVGDQAATRAAADQREFGRHQCAVFRPRLGNAKSVARFRPRERAEAHAIGSRVVLKQHLVGRHVDDGVGGLAGQDIHAQKSMPFSRRRTTFRPVTCSYQASLPRGTRSWAS